MKLAFFRDTYGNHKLAQFIEVRYHDYEYPGSNPRIPKKLFRMKMTQLHLVVEKYCLTHSFQVSWEATNSVNN